MSTDPIVTVLLPVRDAAQTLPACLRSVARQVEARLRCLVIDDGSTDESAEIAAAFAAADRRFELVRRPARGLVETLQLGLTRCDTELVARMDADDLMHRRRLRRQVDLMRRAPEVDAAGCHVRLFPRSSLGPGMRAYERWLGSITTPDDIARDRYVECPIAHPTLIARTNVLAEVGYRDQGWPEDYDLVLRLLARGHRLDMCPERLLSWRHGPGRLSRTDPTYDLERFTECKAAFIANDFLSRDDGYVLWGYGRTGRTLARHLRTHGKRPELIVDVHPGRQGQRILGAEVIAPDALTHDDRRKLVVSVAREGPRGEVRAALNARRLREGRDFICAA